MMNSNSETEAMSADSPAQTMDLEAMRIKVSNMFAQMKASVSLETLRPLPVFMGLRTAESGDVHLRSGAFTPPIAGQDTATMVKSRVHDNWSYFMTNYCLVAAMVAVVVALMHPGSIFTAGIVYSLWWFHGYLIKHEVVLCGIQFHAVLTVQQRFYFFFSVSAMFLVWSCFVPVVFFTLIATFIILFHAAMRDTAHLIDASQRGESEERDDLLSGARVQRV